MISNKLVPSYTFLNQFENSPVGKGLVGWGMEVVDIPVPVVDSRT
jgi:hypothetical protein